MHGNIESKTKLVGGFHSDESGRALAEYYYQHSGKRLAAPYLVLGWMKGDKLTGVIVFNDYNGSNISVHVQIQGVLSKDKIRYVLNYAFNQLKCTRISAVLGEEQLIVRNLVERGGFVFEARLKDWFGIGKDGFMYRMLQADARRWLDG